MIETFIDIKGKTLGKGLRFRETNTRNYFALTQATNVRGNEFGLESLETFIKLDEDILYNYGIRIESPFPQIFKGIEDIFLLTSGRIFKINDLDLGTSAFTLTEIKLYDINNSENEIRANKGSYWSFIDLGKAYLFVNGNSSIFYFPHQKNIVDDVDKAYVDNSVSINCGAFYKGRSVIGGFNSSNFWNDSWKEFWSDWSTKHNYELNLPEGLEQNFIMWSMAGGGDVFSLFYPKLSISGIVQNDYSTTNPLIFDFMKRGDGGFIPVSWSDAVLRVEVLGENLIAYGNNGISILKFFEQPVVTLGEKRISNVGIASNATLCVGKDRHLFISPTGYLYEIDGKFSVKRIGYQEFLSPLLNNNVTISYNYEMDEFYISTNHKCYVYANGRLTESIQKIISTIYYNKTIIIGRTI